MTKRNFVQLLAIVSLIANTTLKAQPIQIGVIGPFSGADTAFGDQIYNGVTQAIDDINTQGGINGDKLALISADDGCDSELGQESSKRLISLDHVNTIIGHFCSSEAILGAKLYTQTNTLFITPAATNPELTQLGIPTLFRTCGNDIEQGNMAAKFMIHRLKAKKIAILYANTLYASTLAKIAKENLLKNNAIIAFEKSIERLSILEKSSRETRDYSDIIQSIDEAKPDVIYYAGMYTEIGPFLKQLRSNNINIPFLGSDGIATSEFVTAAGGPHFVENVYMTFGINSHAKGQNKVIKSLKEKRINPEGYTLNAYAAVQVVAQAIEHTQSLNGDKLANWLHQNSVDTIIGRLSWDNKGDLKNASYFVYQWNDDGKYKQVYP